MNILLKRNVKLSTILGLLFLLIIIFPLNVLASQSGNRSINSKNTKVSNIENKEYSGNKQIQNLTIKYRNSRLKLNTDYTISYENNTQIGLAKIIIKGIGKYSGTITKTFQINPTKIVFDDAKLNKNSVVLTWKKKATVDGYQIYLSNGKNGKYTRLTKLDQTKSSYTIKNVKQGIWYYKIRAYKTVNKKVYYSRFSSVKSISYKTNESNSPTPTEESKNISINVMIGNKNFTATLENNATAKRFANQLPLTINMAELNGNEKYNYLSTNIRENNPSSPDTIEEGDIMLYGENCVVLFYETFRTSYSYVKLGRINNTAGLTQALGSGNVEIIFSINN